jgi:hypothetical protein
VWTGHITEASKPVEVSVVLPTGDEGGEHRGRRGRSARQNASGGRSANCKAGGRLAALLQSAQVTAQSRTLRPRRRSTPVARLTPQGTRRGEVQTLAGANLTPQAIDVLAQFAGS